jgi:hypothetical protein
MTGKSYYITTVGDWLRHAARFARSHYIVLDGFVGAQHAVPGNVPWHDAAHPPESPCDDGFVGARHAVPGNLPWHDAAHPTPSLPEINAGLSQSCQASAPGMACHAPTGENPAPLDAAAKILVLIEADEGVHLALEDDLAFEALPHPLAEKAISTAAQTALARHGVAPGATTFDAAEALARLHPLLKHRVF